MDIEKTIGNKNGELMANIYCEPTLNHRGDLVYELTVYLKGDENYMLHPLLRNSSKTVLDEGLHSEWGMYEGYWRVKSKIIGVDDVEDTINRIAKTIESVVHENEKKLENAKSMHIKVYV